MKSALLTLLVVAVLSSAHGLNAQRRKPRSHALPIPTSAHAQASAADGAPPAAPATLYQTDYYDGMPVDHFGFGTTATFRLKYLYNNASYAAGGPIFFYCGNEGGIEGFGDNTGIMFDLAPTLNAFVLFGEHRYYGTSLPFADTNDTFNDMAHLGYLTTEQTLADYVLLLSAVKAKFNLPASTPVIAFGGSYGGMLAAWFRMKYPSVVAGAWAASAPIMEFRNGGIPLGAYDAVTKSTMLKSNCNEQVVMAGFDAIASLATTDLQSLNDIFVIDPISQLTNATDAIYLIYYIREALEYMAMVNQQ